MYLDEEEKRTAETILFDSFEIRAVVDHNGNVRSDDTLTLEQLRVIPNVIEAVVIASKLRELHEANPEG